MVTKQKSYAQYINIGSCGVQQAGISIKMTLQIIENEHAGLVV